MTWAILPTGYTSFLSGKTLAFFGMKVTDALICFSGGNFLYMALAEMLPNSLHSRRAAEVSDGTLSSIVFDFFKSFIAFCLGVSLLLLTMWQE